MPSLAMAALKRPVSPVPSGLLVLGARRHAQQIANGGGAVDRPTKFGRILIGPIVQRLDAAFLLCETNSQGGNRLRHGMRREAIRRFAVILISLNLDYAILDDDQTHNALARKIVVHRQFAAVFGSPAKVGFPRRFRQSHRLWGRL
jgi:hypothetical protein